MPVKTHLIRVEVIDAMKARNFSPAIFCKPPLIKDMP
jgi:hypothetical protein